MTTDVVVREIQLSNDDELRLVHQVGEASVHADVHAPFSMTFEEFAALTRDTTGAQRRTWLATRRGVPAGVASYLLGTTDNLDKATVFVMVHPEHRGVGLEETLLAYLTDAVPAHRTQLILDVYLPADSAPTALFSAAYAAGFREVLRGIESTLTLPAGADQPSVRRSTLLGLCDVIDAETRARTAAYRIETHVGGLPEHLIPGACELLNLVNVDMPSGPIEWEAATRTPEDYTRTVQQHRDAGLTTVETVALHQATDGVPTIAAITRVGVRPAPNTSVGQWATYVHREHRGHQLGVAVKVANLRRLLNEAPGHEAIYTDTDSGNMHMRAINERLGFVDVQELATLVLTR